MIPKSKLQLPFTSTGIRNAVDVPLTGVRLVGKALGSHIFGYTNVAWNPLQDGILILASRSATSLELSDEASVMAEISVL